MYSDCRDGGSDKKKKGKGGGNALCIMPSSSYHAFRRSNPTAPGTEKEKGRVGQKKKRTSSLLLLIYCSAGNDGVRESKRKEKGNLAPRIDRSVFALCAATGCDFPTVDGRIKKEGKEKSGNRDGAYHQGTFGRWLLGHYSWRKRAAVKKGRGEEREKRPRSPGDVRSLHRHRNLLSRATANEKEVKKEGRKKKGEKGEKGKKKGGARSASNHNADRNFD